MMLAHKYTYPGTNKGAGGAPKYTFKDLAARFGMTVGALRYAFRDEDAPKPCLKRGSKLSGINSYYDIVEVKAWWGRRAQRKKMLE